MEKHHGLIVVSCRYVRCECGWNYRGPIFDLWPTYSRHLDAA